MTISQKGIDLVKEFEQLYLTAYQCAAKVWTIGWGTTTYPNSRDVKEGDKCTKEEAEAYLIHDMTQFSKQVSEITDGIKLSQLQFDALVSMGYNIGASALRNSSLITMMRIDINSPQIIGNDSMNYKEWGRDGLFTRWSMVKKVRNKGLIRRRKAEAWLFATGELRFFEEMNGDFQTPLRDYVNRPIKI